MWVQVFLFPVEKHENCFILMSIGKVFGECFEVGNIVGFDIHGMFNRIIVNFQLKVPLTKEVLLNLGDEDILGLVCLFACLFF